MPRADSVEQWSLAKSGQEHGRIATYAVSGGCTSSTGTGTGASATSGVYEVREIKEKASEEWMDGGAGVGAACARRRLPADGLANNVPKYEHALLGTLHRRRKLNAFLSGEMDVNLRFSPTVSPHPGRTCYFLSLNAPAEPGTQSLGEAAPYQSPEMAWVTRMVALVPDPRRVLVYPRSDIIGPAVGPTY
ncbi:hypothetical protein JB92DRAFT_3147344 [Gautieria morchelliformis]|nr:hypothetical protein JB92DRAFT_3147344 [Gautieria morchelliformis]